MRDFAVHEMAGTGRPSGLRRLVSPVRQLLVRLLLPIFRRLATLLQDMDDEQHRLKNQQECLGRQLDALLDRGWDHTTLLRRVAILERQVEILDQQMTLAGRLIDDRPAKAG